MSAPTTSEAGTHGARGPVWLEARGITKQFGAVLALADVDVSISLGEVIGLIGDNGSGKSTFVKILSGVYQPSSGSLLVEGKPVRFHSAADARAMGVETVHQDLGLVDSMSIARNFFLGAERRKGPFLDLKRMERETTAMLKEIGLGNLRAVGQDVSKLSGGERQAISIGRAVAFQRKMLILDEPTSALSIQETQKVFEFIRAARDRGLAVLTVMHNLEQVRDIADRFVVFYHGHKIADIVNTGQSEADLAHYIIEGKLAEMGVDRDQVDTGVVRAITAE